MAASCSVSGSIFYIAKNLPSLLHINESLTFFPSSLVRVEPQHKFLIRALQVLLRVMWGAMKPGVEIFHVGLLNIQFSSPPHPSLKYIKYLGSLSDSQYIGSSLK